MSTADYISLVELRCELRESKPTITYRTPTWALTATRLVEKARSTGVSVTSYVPAEAFYAVCAGLRAHGLTRKWLSHDGQAVIFALMREGGPEVRVAVHTRARL